MQLSASICSHRCQFGHFANVLQEALLKAKVKVTAIVITAKVLAVVLAMCYMLLVICELLNGPNSLSLLPWLRYHLSSSNTNRCTFRATADFMPWREILDIALDLVCM